MRALLGLSVVLAVGGCTSFSDVEQAKPYSCSWRDAGPDECPTGWRCGYDNRCFDPAVPAGLRACKLDTDCFTNYRCSFDNQCFNPKVETPRSCSVDLQCADDWRCGAGQSCFNPNEPVARPCAATTDCATGWRCGVSGLCQDRSVGAPYVCRADEDCEVDWRCDVLAERCVLVRDALAGSAAPVTAEVFHPRLESGLPSHVAVGAPTRPGQNSDTVRLASSVVDGGVRLVLVGRDGVLAQSFAALPFAESTVVDLVALTVSAALRTVAGEVFVATLDGGITRVGSGPTHLRQVDPVSLGSPFSDANSPRLAALVGGTDYGLLTASLSGVSTEPFDAGQGMRVPVLLDIASYGTSVALLTDEGVSFTDGPTVAQSCSDRLIPPELRVPLEDGGQPSCNSGGPLLRLDAGATYTLLHALLDQQSAVGVVSTKADGTTLLGIGLRRFNTIEVRGDAFPPCPSGATPEQLALTAIGEATRREYVAIARCPAVVTDGGVVPATTWTVAPSNRPTPRYERVEPNDAPWKQGIRAQKTTSNTRAHGGRNGLFWYSNVDSIGVPLDFLTPLFLDRRPEGVVRVRGDANQVVAFTGNYLYQWAPATGFGVQGDAITDASAFAKFVPIGTVTGKPTWQVTRTGVMDVASFPLGSDSPQFLAVVATGVETLTPPASAQVQDLPDGTRLLVVVSGERLLTADITVPERNMFAPSAALEVRLVPSSGVPLRGLSIDPRPRQGLDGGALAAATGFVLTDNATYAFSALSPSRWSLTPVPVPERFGAPIDLWNESGRARLAFERGAILTLPERVPVAADIGGDAGVVSDFARLCGTTYAVRGDANQVVAFTGNYLYQWAPAT
ncbi:MAG: hypothetical protein JNG84_00750, partial [Archangium sp.]|nr:hypothetical protein [Archangium sp.]